MQIMITAALLAWFLVFKLQPDLRAERIDVLRYYVHKRILAENRFYL